MEAVPVEGLDGWCERTGTSLAEVARRAGVAYTTALEAKAGRLGRYAVAVLISDVTGGEVRPETLCAETVREARAKRDNPPALTGTDGGE